MQRKLYSRFRFFSILLRKKKKDQISIIFQKINIYLSRNNLTDKSSLTDLDRLAWSLRLWALSAEFHTD